MFCCSLSFETWLAALGKMLPRAAGFDTLRSPLHVPLLTLTPCFSRRPQDKLIDPTSVTRVFKVTKFIGMLVTGFPGTCGAGSVEGLCVSAKAHRSACATSLRSTRTLSRASVV